MAKALVGAQVVEDAMLAVSELVTNAVRYTWSALLGGKVVVLVNTSAQGVRIVVVDQGSAFAPAVPDAKAPKQLSESGRGLKVVAALASGWGFEVLPVGRAVWADFTARPFAEAPQAHITEILTLAGVELRPAHRSAASFRAGPWHLAMGIDDHRAGAHVAGWLPRYGRQGDGLAEFFDDPEVAMRVFLDLVGELATGPAGEG